MRKNYSDTLEATNTDKNAPKKKQGALHAVGVVLKVLFISSGLWIPILYTLLGVILTNVANINVLDFSVKSVIYIVGWFGSIIVCLSIIVYQLFIRPIQNARLKREDKRQKTEEFRDYPEMEEPPVYEEDKVETEILKVPSEDECLSELRKEEEKRRNPKAAEEEAREEAKLMLFGSDEEINAYMRQKRGETIEEEVVDQDMERPQIYFSKLRPNILVYEYSDRFELYKVEGDSKEYLGVAQK